MGNLLRDIFDPNSEYNKKLKERTEQITQQWVENNSCHYCKNALHPGHFEMGKYSGTDTYCRMTKELKKCSDTCLFYNYNEVFREKHMEKLECEKCKYWNTEDCYCTWLSCDGLDCDEKLPCENEDKEMTYDDLLDEFSDTFPFAKIEDCRPICHELFTDDKVGITIWLDNGDIIEYYPKQKGENK